MSKKQSIEIEIQVQVEKINKLLRFLKKNGQLVGKQRQIDSYYTPAHRNFTNTRPVKEWLRIRNSSAKSSINYKNWHFDKDGRSHYCDEYETAISDTEQMEKIIKALNMKPVVTVDKTRIIWTYQDYEIALDSIKKLGDFVEIEYKGLTKNKKPAVITQEMIEFLKQMDCGKISRNYVGYPFQILFPSEVKYEEF